MLSQEPTAGRVDREQTYVSCSSFSLRQPFDPLGKPEGGHWLCVSVFPRICLFEEQVDMSRPALSVFLLTCDPSLRADRCEHKSYRTLNLEL